jgi:hypothetical protein
VPAAPSNSNAEPSRDVAINVRLAPDDAALLREMAAEGDRTLNREVGRAIRKHVSEYRERKRQATPMSLR